MIVKKSDPELCANVLLFILSILATLPVVANESRFHVVEKLEGVRFFFVIISCLVKYGCKNTRPIPFLHQK